MKKYGVTLYYTAYKYVEVEAENGEQALDKAYEQSHVGLCHQCAKDVEIGDCYQEDVEEFTE